MLSHRGSYFRFLLQKFFYEQILKTCHIYFNTLYTAV